MAASEPIIEELFEKNRSGRLMQIQDNEFSRYQFEIWFEYTRQSMMQLKEGTLLAAKNFACDDCGTHYSILELTSIKPIHYALGNNIDGYPGFVMEAARNISTDWTNQESESSEDTTIIQCTATPTEIEIFRDDKKWDLGSDSSIPMIGTEVKVVTASITKQIVNRDFSEKDNVIEAGKWLVDKTTPILMKNDDFLRVHFGIFGFTKAGKSNLLSSFISKLFEASKQGIPGEDANKKPIKIVVFDLMNEYNVLLIDQLVKLQDATLLALGPRTFPKSVIDYISDKQKDKEIAVKDFVNTSLYPQHFENNKEDFKPFVQLLFEKNKIRIFQEPITSDHEFIDKIQYILNAGADKESKSAFQKFVDNIRNSHKPIDITLIIELLDAVDSLIKENNSGDILFGVTLPKKGWGAHASSNLNKARSFLRSEKYNRSNILPEKATLKMDTLLNSLNDGTRSSLVIVQSHDPDELREFASDLGNALFEERRKTGKISPLVSFIFDEADEFIPQTPEKDTTQGLSVKIVELLARRGRKFGIGIGIATQRTRYLKTSIMAQPHTYLISKLPRRTDREAVQEAFGFSDEIFRQTFKFTKGDWLLISYDATGLTGVPIPIHADDANKRIEKAIKEIHQ